MRPAMVGRGGRTARGACQARGRGGRRPWPAWCSPWPAAARRSRWDRPRPRRPRRATWRRPSSCSPGWPTPGRRSASARPARSRSPGRARSTDPRAAPARSLPQHPERRLLPDAGQAGHVHHGRGRRGRAAGPQPAGPAAGQLGRPHQPARGRGGGADGGHHQARRNPGPARDHHRRPDLVNAGDAATAHRRRVRLRNGKQEPGAPGSAPAATAADANYAASNHP